MAIIPSTEKFIGLSANVDTVNKRSAIINEESQAYTMQDIIDTVENALPSSAPAMFIATFTENGTNDPTFTEIVGDFSPDSIARQSAGYYELYFPTGTFNEKTIVTLNAAATTSTFPVGVFGVQLSLQYDSITILAKNPATGAAADGFLGGSRISIQVFE